MFGSGNYKGLLYGAIAIGFIIGFCIGYFPFRKNHPKSAIWIGLGFGIALPIIVIEILSRGSGHGFVNPITFFSQTTPSQQTTVGPSTIVSVGK